MENDQKPVYCDFCYNPEEQVVFFNCPEFTLQAIPPEGPAIDAGFFDSQWAACSACEKLIRARDMDGLIARVGASQAILTPDVDQSIIENMRIPFMMIFRTLDSESAVHN